MKSLMLLGGWIGLGIGLLFGLADNGQRPDTLWRACAAALMGGVMLRRWGRVWMRSLREAGAKRVGQSPEEPQEQSIP